MAGHWLHELFHAHHPRGDPVDILDSPGLFATTLQCFRFATNVDQPCGGCQLPCMQISFHFQMKSSTYILFCIGMDFFPNTTRANSTFLCLEPIS